MKGQLLWEEQGLVIRTIRLNMCHLLLCSEHTSVIGDKEHENRATTRIVTKENTDMLDDAEPSR